MSDTSKVVFQKGQMLASAIKNAAAIETNTVKKQIGVPTPEKRLEGDEIVFDDDTPPQVVTEAKKETVDREAIKRMEVEKLKELEARLAELRAIRLREDTQRIKETDEQFKALEDASAPPQVEGSAPTGKIKRAMGSVGKAVKRVASVVQNRRQGEQKQGQGKG